MKRIKIGLKLILIAIFSFIIVILFNSLSVKASESTYLSYSNNRLYAGSIYSNYIRINTLASKMIDYPSHFIDNTTSTAVTGMLGSKIQLEASSPEAVDYDNALCYSEGSSNSNYDNDLSTGSRTLVTVLDISYSSSNNGLTFTSYTYGQDTESKTLGGGLTNYTTLGKLAYATANVLSYTTQANTYNTRGEDYVGRLLNACYSLLNLHSSVQNNYSAIDTNASNYENFIDSTAVKNYSTKVNSYRKLSVNSDSAVVDTETNSSYVIIGPYYLTFAGTTINTITASSSYSGTVGWASSKTATPSTSFSSITSSSTTSNTNPVYIFLNKSGFSSTSNITVKLTFTQTSFNFYHSRIWFFANNSTSNQQYVLISTEDETITGSGTSTVTFDLSTPTSIKIIKTDSSTGQLISGIGFQIYYTSSGTNYYLHANSSGVYTEWSETATTHYTDSNGEINISSIPIRKDESLTIYVQEISTESTQLYYIEDTSVQSSLILDDTYTDSNPLTFYLDNDPLSLTIEKRKNTTTGALMNNVGFRLQYSDGTWVYGTGDGHKSYTSTGTTYKTGDTSTGKVTITGLKKGTYTIYEVSIDSSVHPGYSLENQTGYDSSTGMVCWGTVTLNTSGQTSYTAGPYANITGALQITKYDEDESTKLSGFKFVFVWASSTSSTTYKYIYGTPGSTADPYAAISTGNYNTYTTDSNGQIKVEYLKAGIYYIYEIETSNTDDNGTENGPYFLTDQDEASNEPTSLKNSSSISSSWKYQGYIEIDSSTTLSNPATTIHTSSSTTTTKILNYKRIKITGYVWVDEDISKDDTYNSLYDSGTETLVEGVTVYLYNKTTGQVTSSNNDEYLTTSSDGSYTFGYEWGVQYRYVSNYYIKFDYSDLSIKGAHDATEASSGTEFIPVAFNRGTSTTSTIYANSSKAMMDYVATYDTVIDAVSESSEDGATLDGEATTYTSDSYENLYGLSAFLSSSNETLYNNGTYTLTNINLGIKKIYDPEYDIVENLEYVKIEINGYSYLYEYGSTQTVDGDPFDVTVPTVSFETDNGTKSYSCYTKYMYPSDLKEGLTTNGTLKVYVVYGITIKNTTTYNVSELYMESHLNITSLTNTFDSDRYELDNTSNTNDVSIESGGFTLENDYNNTFAYWNETDEENVVEYDLSKDSIEGETGLESNESKTVYIQFKVKSEEVRKILNSGTTGTTENLDYPTTATTNGYHTYTRNDYSWANTTDTTRTAIQTHYTKSEEEVDSAPYMKFLLGEDRVLSGIVFEDSVVTTDEVLGNGIADEYTYSDTSITSEENSVSNVLVELLEANEDGSIVKDTNEDAVVASGYKLDDDGNVTTEAKVCNELGGSVTSADNYTVTTNESGYFRFEGMVPERYVLRFTYEDGTSKIYSYDSTSGAYEEVSTICLNDYKSTIVTSAKVKKAINDMYKNEDTYIDEDGNTITTEYTEEWYKYYDDDNNIYYSVAVDDLNQREKYNEGLVYTYSDGGDGEIDSVESHSYTTNENGDTEEITEMEAYTPMFSITIENTEDTSSSSDSSGDNTTHEYEYTGFNFGIVEQAVQSVKVEKVITNISMVNSPTTIFNGNPETGDLDGVSDLDGSTNGSSTYTRIEVEENDMYGANLTVTYTLTITNTSDLNYYETSDYYQGYYYMFGLHGSSYYSEEIKISIDSVLDTYDNDLTWLIDNTTETTYTYKVTSSASNDSTSEGYLIETDATAPAGSTTEEGLSGDTYTTWEMVSSSGDDEDNVSKVEVYDITMTLAENKANARSNKGYDFYDGEVLYLDDWGDISRSESFTLSVVFTKTMSSSDDDTSYENVATVNKLSITENSNSSISTDRDSTKYVRKPQVPDPADSYITISPPTGYNKQTIIIYTLVGVVGLIILSVGIVIIKKKVL